jgi:UDP-glucose:(glucosyl)LPS alpha-1,2-glucosyltransferase
MSAPPVAIVLPYREFFSPGSSGALGLLARRMATWRDGFAPYVVGPPPPTPAFGDVPFHAARATWWWPGNAAARYRHAVAGVLRRHRPALVEVHNRPELALYLARAFPGVPVSLFLNNDPQGMRGARSAGERAELLRRMAVVANCSAYLRSRLLEGVAAPARDPVVLHNWLDLAEVPESPAERERVILFAGRVVRDKGSDSFVEACATALPRLPGWRAVMIGADRFGPDSPETPFLERLRPLASAAGVEMWGYRPHAEVMAAMARAAMVVVPSRWPEPFGLTALEAMAAGAALLCAPRGGLPEVFGEAGVAIDPDDPAGLAAEILALAGNPGRMAALGAAGRARARQFDLPQAARRLDGLRRQALGMG